MPTGGSSGPTAGAEIRGGRYKIAASDGPPAFDKKINFIPESYNVASKLVATIDAPRGVATLDFELTQPSK